MGEEKDASEVTSSLLRQRMTDEMNSYRNDVIAKDRIIADLNLQVKDKMERLEQAFEMLAEEATRAEQLSVQLNACSAKEAHAVREHEEALVRIAEKDSEIEQLLALSSGSGQPANISVLTAELASLKAAERTRKLDEAHAKVPLQEAQKENQALRAHIHELRARESQLETEKAAALDQVSVLERQVIEAQDRIQELEFERTCASRSDPPLQLQSWEESECLKTPSESLTGGGYQRLHTNVRALNDLLQDTRALRLKSPRGTPRSTGARTPRSSSLHSSAASTITARDRSEPAASVTNVTMRIGIKFTSAGEAGSRQRAQFSKDLVRDLEHASGVPRTSFLIKSVSPGSVVVNLDICAERSIDIARDLARQARDAASLLCGGVVTRKVETLSISCHIRPLPPQPAGDAEPADQGAVRAAEGEDAVWLARASDLLVAALHHLKKASRGASDPTPDDFALTAQTTSPQHHTPCRRLLSLAEEIEKEAISTCELLQSVQEAEEANQRVHESELDERREAHARLRDKNQALDERVVALQSQVRELQEASSSRHAGASSPPNHEAVASLKGQVVRLQETNASLSLDLERIREELEQKRAGLERENEELRGVIQDLEEAAAVEKSRGEPAPSIVLVEHDGAAPAQQAADMHHVRLDDRARHELEALQLEAARLRDLVEKTLVQQADDNMIARQKWRSRVLDLQKRLAQESHQESDSFQARDSDLAALKLQLQDAERRHELKTAEAQALQAELSRRVCVQSLEGTGPRSDAPAPPRRALEPPKPLRPIVHVGSVVAQPLLPDADSAI